MENLLTIEDFTNLVFEFRGKKVMLDMDLAALYETETKKLKQQVKRNLGRFPSDFMFELSKDEKRMLLSSHVRLMRLKHSSVNPMVFTEQGVAMLSSVLTSRKALDINIEIMRAFVQYRSILLDAKEMRKEIRKIDKKLSQAFSFLLNKIEALGPNKETSMAPIGFKQAT